eukprot:403365769
MIKDLLQYKFGDSNSTYTQVRSPQAGNHSRSNSAMKSIISKGGDVKKNSDKLKFLLLSIKFPQQYNEKESLEGHPTQFMKIINYSMFVASASVKNYLYGKGVDPDTVYLNDFKFMKKVFKILVSIFGYKPSITLEQFFKYGFAEQKILLCCDTINLVKKAAKDLKVQKSLSRKRSETTRDQQVSSYTIINHKKIVDGQSAQKSFAYERDPVNKVAKVQNLNKDLQQARQSRNDQRNSSISDAKDKSQTRLSSSASKILNGSLRYSHVQSRYMDPRQSSQNQTIDQVQYQSQQAADNTQTAEYKPLRVRSKQAANVSQVQQQTQNFQQTAIFNPQLDIMLQLKNVRYKTSFILQFQTIESLSSKFDNFQKVVDNKINSIHHDYHTLTTKLETISQKQSIEPGRQPIAHLKERGDFASPSHFSDQYANGGRHIQSVNEEPINPLKEFTFTDKGSYAGLEANANTQQELNQQRMYSTDGFAQQKHYTSGAGLDFNGSLVPRDLLVEESRVLIQTIQKNLDESKKDLEKFNTQHNH